MLQPKCKTLSARHQGMLGGALTGEWTLPDGTTWTEFRRLNSEFHVRFPGYADFEVANDGTEVVCIPCVGTAEPILDHLFTNQVRPLALALQGVPTFHAAAVSVHGKAVAFLAASGRGKSTLAASFGRRGDGFLSDDCLILEQFEDRLSVVPSVPTVRLRADSRSVLMHDDASAAPQVAYSPKQRFYASEQLVFHDESLPLRAAYVLGDGSADSIEIEPILGGDRIPNWVGHSFLVDVTDPELLTRNFDTCARIARIVPMFHLDYPRRYELIDELLERLHGHSLELDKTYES